MLLLRVSWLEYSRIRCDEMRRPEVWRYDPAMVSDIDLERLRYLLFESERHPFRLHETSPIGTDRHVFGSGRNASQYYGLGDEHG